MLLGAWDQAVTQGVRHAALEVTSKALAAGFAKFWRFDLAVFTNLSREHLVEIVDIQIEHLRAVLDATEDPVEQASLLLQLGLAKASTGAGVAAAATELAR